MPNTYNPSDEAGGRSDRALELYLKGVEPEAIKIRLGYSDIKHTNRAINLAKRRAPKKDADE